MSENRDVDLLKIQIISEQCHSMLNSKLSFIFGMTIAFLVLFYTLYYDGTFSGLVFSLTVSGLLISTYVVMWSTNKQYKKDLMKISDMIEKVKDAKELPPLNEIKMAKVEKMKTKKEEKNDFLQLVKDNRETINQNDLKSLLKVRLEFPSKTSITNRTASTSVILGLVSANIALIAIYYSPSIMGNEFLQLVASFVIILPAVASIIAIISISRDMVKKKKNVNNEEIAVMNQYLEAIKELKKNEN